MAATAAVPKFILLIEDNCDHASAITATLELEGYRVERAPNGASGLHRVEQELPDLVLLDFTLPDMSGADVGHALRRRTPPIPIIIESGMPEWVVRSYFRDFDAFLGKPLDPQHLLNLITGLTANKNEKSAD
jgi:two-component system phosphate regulon response regulator PhoB